jgi:hypothetical protein
VKMDIAGRPLDARDPPVRRRVLVA